MDKIIDGKKIAAGIREGIKAEAASMETKPGLAVILVGNDPASTVYVRNKERACKQAGFASVMLRLPEDTSEDALLAEIDKLNKDEKIHGILVQLPLPKGLNERRVLAAILPEKDVDGFSSDNVGALVLGEDAPIACTPAGCIELIKSTGITMDGANAVVIGRSNIVGKPLALLLLRENCTVTVCHSHTKDLASICRNADILIAAIGKPHFISSDMVKPGAVVIDVGINRLEDGSLCGDVDYDAVSPIAGAITPVPGGVGPMTIAMLLKNTLKQAKKHV